MRSRSLSALFLVLILGSGSALAHAAGRSDGPSNWALFGQTGWAEADVSSYAIGAWHSLPWSAQIGRTSIRSYAEYTLSRWVADDLQRAESRRFTQFGVAPVLRFQHSRTPRGLFLDLGIGAYLITPIYQHDNKRFGSAYNFGDQIAVGMRLGRAGRQEVSLRLQHFSNGGIKQPNPGENFLQARVLIRFAS